MVAQSHWLPSDVGPCDCVRSLFQLQFFNAIFGGFLLNYNLINIRL